MVTRQTFQIKHQFVAGMILPRRTVSTIGKFSSAVSSVYNCEYVENKWQDVAKRKGDPSKKFVMLLPPPNVTGTLHLGHALTCTIQDAIAKWHIMNGYDVTWVPGTDHAGIATQVIVEKKLWSTRQVTRQQIGRESFVKEVWRWKEEKGTAIKNQMKRLGLSLNWEKEYFTLDESLGLSVKSAFIKLYEDGYIYNAEALVNWCCALQSTLSDIEVDHMEITSPQKFVIPGYDQLVEFGRMYQIVYEIMDSSDKVTVFTTRPETLLGDTALMVHPSDTRYMHLVGKFAYHPFRYEAIPIISDVKVDPDFGTGVVKVTPAHDFNDFDVSKGHNIRTLTVFDDLGCINNVVPLLKGLPRFKARDIILNELAKKGLYAGSHAHKMTIPLCSRTRDIVEPLLKPQWFLECDQMLKPAYDAITSGELRIHPSFCEQIWKEWLSRNRPWCVSRQLWWGHTIPMYKVFFNDEWKWVGALSEEEARQKAALNFGTSSCHIVPETDVLDTWFSSALLPLSVFGWPNETASFDKYFPTSLLETGNDIIFFWVIRMVMLSLHLTGKLPFKEVLFHGLICDDEGHKMSKSRGNIINPMDIINGISLQDLKSQLLNYHKEGILTSDDLKAAVSKREKEFPHGVPPYGADSLRFSLCSANIKNQLITVDMKLIRSNFHFCNKMWQTVRFFMMSLDRVADSENYLCHFPYSERDKLSVLDKWVLSHLSSLVTKSNEAFKEYDLHIAGQAFHKFWYSSLCDVYLEAVKPVLREVSIKSRYVISVLWTCIHTALLAIHPLMPHITEELYQILPSYGMKKRHILENDFPSTDNFSQWKDIAVEEAVREFIRISQAIRCLKTSYDLPKSKVRIRIVCNSEEMIEFLNDQKNALENLSQAAHIEVFDTSSYTATEAMAAVLISESTSVYLHIKGIIDPQEGILKVQKKLDKTVEAISKLETKINSSKFLKKAPKDVQKHIFDSIASLVNNKVQLRIQLELFNKLKSENT